MVATAILKEGVETFRCNMVVQEKERCSLDREEGSIALESKLCHPRASVSLTSDVPSPDDLDIDLSLFC